MENFLECEVSDSSRGSCTLIELGQFRLAGPEASGDSGLILAWTKRTPSGVHWLIRTSNFAMKGAVALAWLALTRNKSVSGAMFTCPDISSSIPSVKSSSGLDVAVRGDDVLQIRSSGVHCSESS